MGNKPTVSSNYISQEHFERKSILGRGGFGRVWEVVHKKTQCSFAMKEMEKHRIITKQGVFSVKNELQILSRLKHPFIVNMQYAFHTKKNLYLVLDLMNGGDLRCHLNAIKELSEREAKFIIGSIITGLEFLHVNGVVHRDIKPENIIFDSKGYLRIGDFGIARKLYNGKCIGESGTPSYMAPEILLKQPHGIESDYFSVGVLLYEFMMGKRPFIGEDKHEIRKDILSKEVFLKRRDVPLGWSLEATDFVNKLLHKNPIFRLGVNGPSEIKQHAWFRGFPWKKIFEKSLESPFARECSSVVVNESWNSTHSISYLSTENLHEWFDDYYFFEDE